jgi:hypothetical protein
MKTGPFEGPMTVNRVSSHPRSHGFLIQKVLAFDGTEDGDEKNKKA